MIDLYTLIDTKQYIDTNCYQHQMSEALEARFNVKYITLGDLNMSEVPRNAPVLSRLKLRSVYNNLARLREALEARPVMVYDQDPWESFMIDSPYSGAYQKIYDTLNVSTFLNISHWWRDRVRDLDLPSQFVQVWTLPRYCRAQAVPWKDRKHDVVFCGTMYPRRKAFFDSLEALGVKVEVLPAGKSYPDYLDDIAQARIAMRSEQLSWTINTGSGIETITSANALWKRDIETAAQGCFSMRDGDSEMNHWHIDKIPSIIPFKDVATAAQNVKWVLQLAPDLADELSQEGIDFIRAAPGWSVTCDVIESTVAAC